LAKISVTGNSAVSFSGTLCYPVVGKEYLIKDTYNNYLKALVYASDGKISITEPFTQTVDSIARKIKKGTVQLNGLGTTRVSFKQDLVASVFGTESGPFDLSSEDKTLIVTPDGESQETITFTADCAEDTSEATAEEIVAFINEEATNFTADLTDEDKIVLLGKIVGKDGNLVIDGGSTAISVFGISDGTYGGAQGLKFGVGMLPDYVVNPVLIDSTTLADTDLGISNKTSNEFSIDCEDTDSEEFVDLIISGEEAGL